MSELIAKTLQESFERLQKELAANELKGIIDTKPVKVTDDGEGFYHYEMFIGDGKTSLVLEYEEEEGRYLFSVGWDIPANRILAYYELWDDFDDDEYFCEYRTDDGPGYLILSTRVESAWKKADGGFLQKMKNAALKAWRAYKKIEGQPAEYFKEKEQKYDNIEKFMLEAAKSAERIEGRLTFPDNQIFVQGGVLSERLTLDLKAKSPKGSPEFTLSYDPVQDELEISATAIRGGLTQKKCDPIVKTFLENRADPENKYYNYSWGRGKDGTFEIQNDINMSNYDLDRFDPRVIADKIIRLYRNAKTLADILKTNPDISVEAIRDVARNVKMPETLTASHSASAGSTAPSARASAREMPIAAKPASRPADSSAAFSELASVILNLLNNNANLAKILPDKPGDPREKDGALVVRAPLSDSPLALRLAYDPGKRLVVGGWEGNAGDGLVGRLRKWRKKTRIDAGFDIDDDTGIFFVYIEEATGGDKPVLADPGAFALKVAGIYDPTLDLYKKVTD